MSRIRRRLERGQALVEFALVIPIFLLMLVALFDLGRAVFAYNTLTNAARALKDNGARTVSAAATHAVLSGPAVDRIAASVLDEVVVSDTVPLSDAAVRTGKMKVLSVSRILGEAIKRIHNGDSVSSLFV